jgi:hypothetical protein
VAEPSEPTLVAELAALGDEALSLGEHDVALAILGATTLARVGDESRALLRVGALLAASATGIPRSDTLVRAARAILCRVTVARQLPELAAGELGIALLHEVLAHRGTRLDLEAEVCAHAATRLEVERLERALAELRDVGLRSPVGASPSGDRS